MATFKGAVLTCQACGNIFKVPPVRAATAKFCSAKCSQEHRLDHLKVDKIRKVCPTCGKVFMVYPSHDRGANQNCSKNCTYKDPSYLAELSTRTQGAGNGMWREGAVTRQDGYTYENCYGHPFASCNYVLQHRLVVERHLISQQPLNTEYLVRLGNNWYLNPKFTVHHVNGKRKDNRIENLQVMTFSEHSKLHNKLRREATRLNG